MKTRALALTTAGVLAAATIQATAEPSTAVAVPTPATATTATTAAASPRAADDTVRPFVPAGAIATNGRVSRLARVGEAVVVRGRFTQVGRYTGPAVALDTTTAAGRTFPVLDDGMVSVSLPDGAGGWYAAGLFDQAGDQARNSIVHVLADGSVDPVFRASVDTFEGVYSLALAGSTLYLGGAFDTVNRQDRQNLAAVSATTGRLTPFRRDVTAPVRELAYGPAAGARPARLYVGQREVVAFDPTTGALDASFDSVLPRRDKYELAVDGDRVYVGGNGVVALDADTGAIDPTFDAGGLGQPNNTVDDAVSTLVVDGDRLLVGGSYDTINGSEGPLAALDLATGTPDPLFRPGVGALGSDGVNRGVFDVSVVGDRIWVGGHFGTVGGTAAHNLAVLDSTTGTRIPLDLPRPNGDVNAVDASGGAVLVGGAFTMTAPLAARNIARLDATTLAPLTGGDTDVNAFTDLVVDASVTAPADQVLYSVGRAGVVAIDPVTGATRPALTHDVPGLRAASAGNGRLVVVQDTSPTVQFGRNRVVVWSSTTGERRSSTALSLRGYVTDARVVGDSVLISGSFKRTVNGRAKNLAVLKWNLPGRRLGRFDPHLNGPVYDISDSGPVVVSGLFTQVNEDFPRIARDQRGLARLGAAGVPSRRFVGGIGRGSGNDVTLLPVDSRRIAFTDLNRGYYADVTFRSAVTGRGIPDPTRRYGLTWTTPLPGGDFAYAATTADYAYGPGFGFVAAVR